MKEHALAHIKLQQLKKKKILKIQILIQDLDLDFEFKIMGKNKSWR